jgi:hypothetical protein
VHSDTHTAGSRRVPGVDADHVEPVEWPAMRRSTIFLGGGAAGIIIP